MASFRRRNLDVIENEHSLGAAVAAAVIGTWDWHIRENKVYANERFARTFGLDPISAASGAPVEEFIAAIHPEDRERVRQQIVAAVASGDFFAEEYRVIGDDGSVRWVLARGRCFRDSAGRPIRFPGAVTDITERREREETERVLTGELHHRFRNLLGIVQTIAMATLKDDVPIAVARDTLMERLSAASLALCTLTNLDRQTTDLRTIVESAIAGAADMVRFSVEGERIAVGPEQSLAIVLAIHELTTNAIKHGALSAPTGAVSLRWRIDPETGNFAMAWKEEGGPPVSQPTRQGFGTFLLEHNIAAELKGAVSLAYEPTGLHWTVTAPLARLC